MLELTTEDLLALLGRLYAEREMLLRRVAELEQQKAQVETPARPSMG